VSREPTIAIDTDLRVRIYRMMVAMRRFEERAHKMFLDNLVKGTTHLGVGQEAVASPGDMRARVEAAEQAGRNSILLLVRRDGAPRFGALSLS
jgi:TPP-dependent pyruvate/acetoin dehydrogenase alpha subunit